MNPTRHVSPPRTNRVGLNLPSQVKYLGLLGDCISAICQQMLGLEIAVDDASDSFLKDTGPDNPFMRLCHDLHLAVHEATVNIIEHAYENRADGRIDISILVDTGKIEITLRDQGISFDPDQVPEPNLDEPQEGGLGVYLIRRLMDEVTYQSDGSGNTLRLVKYLSGEYEQ
jgi:serine/threonine-protein kinase RsbW